MEATLIDTQHDLTKINIEISALERMCLFYGDLIEKYEVLEPAVPETLSWLEDRNSKLGNRMADLMKVREEMGFKS